MLILTKNYSIFMQWKKMLRYVLSLFVLFLQILRSNICLIDLEYIQQKKKKILIPLYRHSAIYS